MLFFSIEKVLFGASVRSVIHVSATMKFVGAISGDLIDHGARVYTKLSVEVTGNDTKLLSCVNIWCSGAAGNTGDILVVVIDTINQEIIVALALSVNAKAA